MIKNECEIVRDLMPNYIENQINDKTKEFVEEHLSSCKECKNIFNAITNESQETSEDKEVDFLKKYNRKMNVLKMVAGVLIIIILAMWTLFIVKYVQEKEECEKISQVLEITEKAFLKIEDIKEKIVNGGNYTVVEEDYKLNTKVVTYYKECNFKINHIAEIPYTKYGRIIGKDDKGYVKHAIIEYGDNSEGIFSFGVGVGTGHSGETSVYSLGSPAYNPLIKYMANYSNLEIRNEKYEEKEYYVIKENYKDEKYSEIWLDKDSILPFREVVFNKGKVEEETRYTWIPDSVTDEDVKIEDQRASEELQRKIDSYNQFEAEVMNSIK